MSTETKTQAGASHHEAHDHDHDHDACGCGHDHHHHHHRSITPIVRSGPKVGRNDPCPCGSGKKYKKCCLAA